MSHDNGTESQPDGSDGSTDNDDDPIDEQSLSTGLSRIEYSPLGGDRWSAAAVADDDARRVQQLLLSRRFPRPAEFRGRVRVNDPMVVASGRSWLPILAGIGVLALTLSALAFGMNLRRNLDTTSNGNGNGLGQGGGSSQAPVTVPVIIDRPPPGTPKVCKLPDERSEQSADIYTGTDVNRQLLPYSPFRIISYPCSNVSAAVRAILLYRDAIVLLQGGKITRAIPFDATRPVSFRQIFDAVRDRSWIAEVSAGVFQVDTALVQLQGTTLSIAAPEVRELRLVNRLHSFLGGRGAKVTIDGVKVTSWDIERGGPDRDPVDGRPYILYERGSRLDINKSEITFLGSDRSGGAYGTAWRTGGTTGSAIDSVFANNWIGVYTLEARDIVFRGNKFLNNDLYGLDPHDYSFNLTVEKNVASGNGSHGLIFSRGVVDSVIRDNIVTDNAGNGIVLDLGSDRNVIENNVVENNKKDGIALIGSGHSKIQNNTIRGNRTGIRLNNPGARSVEVTKNLIESNSTGIHIYGGAGDVRLNSNAIHSTAGSALIVEGATIVRDLEIIDARTGVDTRSAIDLAQVNISNVDVGLIPREQGVIEVRDSSIDAREVALRLLPGTTASQGTDVILSAPEVFKATTNSFKWRHALPYTGLAALVMALALELIRGSRTRGEWAHLAPAGVTNIR